MHDASVFPTSLGLNPQETIFAMSARNTAKLALDIFRKNCALTVVQRMRTAKLQTVINAAIQCCGP